MMIPNYHNHHLTHSKNRKQVDNNKFPKHLLITLLIFQKKREEFQEENIKKLEKIHLKSKIFKNTQTYLKLI